tara:strand:+ start:14889 stop:22772 length:7884 start_codon:yes stop_codon:yes gene_type:complete
MAKQQSPKLQNTSSTDTKIPIKGMTKDLNTSLVGKENWTHARNAINNSKDGDVGTLGNEPGNKVCSSAPYTIIGAIHLYGDKWVLYSTNNEQSEIGKWDDSECKYEPIVNDYTCFQCQNDDGLDSTSFTPCLNFDTQHLITGAAKENFDCTWQVYWDDGKNPSRTLNIDKVPYIQNVISEIGAECTVYEDTACLDCEALRLAPLVDIPCIKLSKSDDGGQLRNGTYQAFIAYTINDQVVGDYYGMSNLQPLFDHEDLLSGLEIEISNLDKGFEYFKLVILSHNQGEIQAKEIGIYSTEQSTISIDYINQALKAVPINTLPLTTPAFEKSDKMYVVNDYLIRQGPTERYDFNYQPIANRIHTHWTVTQFDSDYYKKGGNKPTFMRDEVYSFFIRFVYNTGEKSRSYHIPGRPLSWNGWQAPDGTIISELDQLTGDVNNLSAQASALGLCDTNDSDYAFEIYNTAQNQTDQFWQNPSNLTEGPITDDCGTVIAEGHMAYWQSTERYPNDPVRYNSDIGDDRYDLCGKPIRHHKFPDETFNGSGPGGFLDRSSNNGQSINILGVKFDGIRMPRYSESFGQICSPDNGTPTGPPIPGIVGYEILVGSREGNKSIIAKGLSRNMRQYNLPAGQNAADSTANIGYIPNYPFNSAQADPYLSGDPGFSFGQSDPIVGPQNITQYPQANTAANVFTFHSPETSFNKPFLSPFEIKTYGLTTGRSIGRFRPSENHPQHKLLRNLAMWVGIIVGVGYAIGEMRGRKITKTRRPQGYSMGLQQTRRSGGSVTNTINGPNGGGGGAVGTGAWSITTVTSNINTNQGGNAAGAPAVQGQGGLALTNPDTIINTNEAGQQVPAIGPNDLRNTALTTATIIGAPKLAKQIVYDNTMRVQDGTKTNTLGRGYIGRMQEESYEGRRFSEAPTLAQVLFGIFNFMQLTAEGGQHIIDMIYELVSLQDYAWKYSGHGLYLNTNAPLAGQVSRMLVDKGRYIGPSIQNLTANIRINNLQRPSTVAVSAIAPAGAAGFATPSQVQDDSRFIIGSFNGWWNPTQWRSSPIAAHYTALKVAFKNQYGQLDQIKQIPIGCIHYFEQESVQKDGSGNYYDDISENGIPIEDARFQTKILYGGDCYINRYTEKVIMPFFWDFLDGQPDMFPYDYRLRANVPRPIYWMNTAKYDLSELVRYVVNLGFLQGGNQGLTGISPNALHFLDRPNNDLANDTVGGAGNNAGGVGGGSNAGGPSGGNPNNPNNPGFINAGNDGITQDKGGRSIFHIKNGYMYTHCNGVQDFFVESSLNMGLRDYEDTDDKRHYDFAEYTDVESMFHSKIIRKDNFYKYDFSLSKTRFNTQLISFGQIQDRDYDPITAEKCFTHFPKRLIYSLQAQKEAKKDFWRVFLPMNYKDFKNKVNVIKPMSKSGAVVTFPNLAPALFQGVDQLQTDLGTKLTIGDGGLFSQPMQNIVNADEAHEYGSCESSRSVINTPNGLYYISQAQGKIFNYAGRGLENIANNGMKQWFNKYLPSVLLSQFPELEDCSGWIDNPVAGVGCQSVYDPNYDIVYFCKKDYQALNPECIDFDPCEGFVFNQTACGTAQAVPCCPDGYTFDASSNECIRTTIIEPIVDQELGNVDIVFAIDSSNSVDGNNNVGNMQNFLRGFIDGMSPELSSGQARIGLCHFGAGRNTRDPLYNGQQNLCNNPNTADEMFEGANQVTLTDNQAVLENWIGSPSGATAPFTPDYTSVYGASSRNIVGIGRDFPYGTDIAAGVWCGQNLLYMDGFSRNVKKILITIFDGPQGTDLQTNGQPAMCSPGQYTSAIYTSGAVTGTDVYQNNTVTPTTPDITFGREPLNTFSAAGDLATTWFQNNIVSNAQYTAAPFNQDFYAVVLPPGAAGDFVSYSQLWSSTPGFAYQGDFAVQQDIIDIVDAITAAITPDPVFSCPPGCTLFTDSNGDPMCSCIETTPVTYNDVTTPIDLHDETYFKDVSWTVSYDPKAKAWISFHDWHPDLTIPSLNHFFTTKNFVDTTIPECPPGFTWDPVQQICCQQYPGEFPSEIIVDEVPVITNLETVGCKLDIVIGVDNSGSMGPAMNDLWDDAMTFIDTFVGEFGQSMADGDVQIGIVGWGNQMLNVTPNMSGGLSTNNLVGTQCNLNAGNSSPSMSNYTGSTNWGTMLSNNLLANSISPNGGGTFLQTAFNTVQAQLSNVRQSTLGDRTDEQSYKRISIIITDGAPSAGQAPTNNQGAPFAPNMNSNYPSLNFGYAPNAAESSGQLTIASETYCIYTANTPPANNINAVFNDLTTPAFQQIPLLPANNRDFAEALANNICSITVCSCPPDYQRITTEFSSPASPPYALLDNDADCSEGGGIKNGVCRKIECTCPTDRLPNTYVPNTLTQTGQCPDDIMPNGIALYYNPDTGVGDPTWLNVNPPICRFEFLCCLEPNFEKGGVWKHNDRCDLYTNYYEKDYGWEVELIESVGQTVNTVRSIEYQLESYIYRGNLEGDCGDRFHDLDYNFDHAILHNTEQVSGLLTFNLSPKNNAPLITQFPQITANDIQILYSKEEQKYRFNQFWDVTADRGEFNPNVSEPIFITQLNGYIRDLNQNNINLAKPSFQRKKFRHYWNAVVLRKNESGNRKMLLKLKNSKINVSFR